MTFPAMFPKRPLLLLLLSAFLASCAIAQSPPLTGPYRIAGRVVDAVTGEPVRRATVAALAEEDSHMVASGQSDSDGRFLLDHLPAAKYPLTASKRGFRTAFYDEHDGGYNSAIVTGPGQDTANLVFKLMPAAVLHGTVTADGGDPAESASVLLFKYQGDTTQPRPTDKIEQVDGAMTDDTGAYEFSNLAAGVYLLAVSTSPWYAMHPPPRRTVASEDSPLDVAYPVTYFDSTTDEASASPITLAAGSRQQADLNLHAVPALRLQVTAPRRGNNDIVQPELRQMIFGVQVSAETSTGIDPIHTGIVEFNGVAPGHYELTQGEPPRILDLDTTSSQEIDPNAGTLAVNLTGTLRSTTGALPDNVTVTLEPIGGRGLAGMQANARKGQFQFDAVAPGAWGIIATTQAGSLPVIAISTAGSVLPGNQVTIRDHPLSLIATVSPSLSRVRGFARRDGKGIAGAMIVLIPRQPSAYRALVRRDQADSDGSFSLNDVPAGQYTVVAIEDGWNLDWTDRSTMTRYLPGGVSVTVSGQAGAVIALPVPVPVQPK